ncbi:MAG: tetratricopeptide repeat protein [Planctomycetes bacterium]|nr:tetratricopeptide repeat protein [Planctomycetota bacterium]
MKGFMITSRPGWWLAGIVGLALNLSTTSRAWSQGPAETATTPAGKGVQFQEFEDPVELLDPLQKRTPADEARINAMAAFARGRILEEREDYRGAISAYEKAIEFDPTALPVYKTLISLATNLRRGDLAIKWITRAAEANPTELLFVQQAVRILVETNDTKGAVRILQKAVSAPNVDTHSARYVDFTRMLALMYLELDRTDEAVAALTVVLEALAKPEAYQLTPQLVDTYRKELDFEKIGQVFLKAKKTDQALAAFQMAADLKKGKPHANLSFNLAQVYLQADKPDDALNELQKYINAQTQSKGRAAYDLLSEILMKLGKADELIPRLEKAAENDARNSILQYYLADLYAGANRLDDAEALYKKTLAATVDVQGYVGLAGIYRRQERAEPLLEALAKGYGESGDLAEFAGEIKEIIASPKLLEKLLEQATQISRTPPAKVDFPTGYILANLSGSAKKMELADKLYRLLLSIKKDRAEVLYRELGSHYFDSKQYAEAGQIFMEAAEDDDLSDSRPQNLLMATRALTLADKPDQALAAIMAAQAMIPNNPMLRFQEAWVYYYSRQLDEAIERLEKLIADFPQPIPQIREIVRQSQHTLSNIYVLRGDNRKGEEILEAIFEEDPDDEQVNNDLGYLYADQGKNLEKAEAMIRKAVTAKPENGAYLDSLGWVLFKQGKYEEAIPWLEKAVKNQQGVGDETLFEHLAEAYDRAKQPEKALEAWKKSLELAEKSKNPDQKLIERVKARLEKNKN